jgi:hypothetical protein
LEKEDGMRAGRRLHGIVKPGRRDDAIAFGEEACKVFEVLGAETRLTLGGPGTPAGSIYLLIEARTATELGRVLDRFMTDGDALSLQARVSSSDAPVETREMTTYNIVDLGLPDGVRGRAGQTVLWRPAPGGVDAGLALAKEAAEHLLRLGACRTRVTSIMSGERTGCFASVTEHESFEAQGRTRDAFEQDDAWQAFMIRVTGSEAPGHFISFAEWLDPTR